MADIRIILPSESKTAKKKPGRPPGRPPKKTIVKQSVRSGFTNIKSDDTSVMELFYDNPVMFKKMLNFMINMTDKAILCKIRKEGIYILGQDTSKRNELQAFLDGSRMVSYYYEHDFEIGIATDYLLLLNKKIDKTYSQMIWQSEIKEIDKETKITLVNDDVDIPDMQTIGLCPQYPKLIDESKFNIEDYPISFVFTGKYFKKKITDVKNYHSEGILKISQFGCNNPLTFEYTNENGRLKSMDPVQNRGSKIRLQSKIGPAENFTVSVKAKDWYPVASALLADEIHIGLSMTDRIMTTAKLDDNSIIIKVLTAVS